MRKASFWRRRAKSRPLVGDRGGAPSIQRSVQELRDVEGDVQVPHLAPRTAAAARRGLSEFIVFPHRTHNEGAPCGRQETRLNGHTENRVIVAWMVDGQLGKKIMKKRG